MIKVTFKHPLTKVAEDLTEPQVSILHGVVTIRAVYSDCDGLPWLSQRFNSRPIMGRQCLVDQATIDLHEQDTGLIPIETAR